MNIVAPVFLVQNFAISRHQHRYRIRQEQEPGCEGARRFVDARMSNARVLQIDRVHQMMQGDVGVAASKTREQWGEQSGKRDQRLSSKRAEEQIEPYYIWFYPADLAKQPKRAERIIK
jgi:hypothetical protein